MNPYISELLAAEHRREFAAEAVRERVVALVICCRRSFVAQASAYLRATWARLAETRSTACCAIS